MSKRIALITIGTQGDIQPFVALALRLKEAGHSATLATSADFESFVTGHGVDFVSLGRDLQQFLRQESFRERFVSRRSLLNARALMRQALEMVETATRAAWPVAQQADALVLNMNTSFGIDFAEALGIPAIMVAPQPLTPSGDHPLVIFAPRNFGRMLNRLSYGIMGAQQWFFNLPRNRLRAELMRLPRRRSGGFFRASDGTPLPVLACYSPLLAPRPADWPDNAIVTGFFRLEDQTGWTPPPEFRAFLEAGPPPVYIGFGSMPFGAERNTMLLRRAMELWGGRAVVARGWGGIDPGQLPGNVFGLEKAPHDKLFPLVAGVVHHGGAGTTGAGLTAGRPTFVVPQTVDQPFWGSRVHAIGAGPAPIPLALLTPDKLASTLTELTTSPDYAMRAAALGEALRAEDGTGAGVHAIERIIDEARSYRSSRAPTTLPTRRAKAK